VLHKPTGRNGGVRRARSINHDGPEWLKDQGKQLSIRGKVHVDEGIWAGPARKDFRPCAYSLNS
jgi:hypothetical protein